MKRTRIITSLVQLAMLSALAFGVVRLYWPPAEEEQSFQPGQTFPVEGEIWPAEHATAVVAIQSGCAWCAKGAPFYQRLSTSSQSDRYRVLAVAPDPGSAREYMREKGVEFDEVKKIDFESSGIDGTPTLVVLGKDGRIISSWVGTIAPEREHEVFEALGSARLSAAR